MPTKPGDVRLIKSAISADLLETALWEVTWAEKSLVKNKSASYSWSKLNTEAPGAIGKILKIVDTSVGKDLMFNSVALELMGEGDYIKAAKLNKDWSYPIALVSLGQYRGGKMKLGSYTGYLNPGEILCVDSVENESTGPAQDPYDKKPLLYEVSQINSGCRIVLILYYFRSNNFHDPVY